MSENKQSPSKKPQNKNPQNKKPQSKKPESQKPESKKPESEKPESEKPENGAAEHMNFQAEVSQLLKLMINSLYSNQEIFLRELISNGSDACDKLRFEAIANAALLEDDSELSLTISFDEEAATITVSDNGIGMNRDEVVDNIGTIAKSGTKQFLESLTGDQQVDSQLIGQFGVGFYSAFVVADRVTLSSRRAGDSADQGVRWESDASGGYTLSQIDKSARGTEVTLHVKEESKEFLNGWRLRNVIKKYSDHITFPIKMLEELPPPAEDSEDTDEPVKEAELEQINDASALWAQPKSKISADEYESFYKQISHDFESPLAWTHNRVEGTQEYISLLYIPQKAPFDLYEGGVQRNGIKLFVQRVFIMDEAEKLMPRYLRFVRGLVDSNDLPLNVSREILQDSKIIDTIRRASVKKILSLLEALAEKEPEKYKTFWDAFGQCLKEAPGEDFANKEQVAKLYRFASTHSDSEEQVTSLDAYIARMKPGQEKIYFITADSYQAASNSPHLEIFKEKEIEVLLMHDRVDEWMMSYLNEYESKSFDSVAKGDLDLSTIGLDNAEKDEDKKAKEQKATDAEPLIKRIQEVLSDATSEVRASTRLTTSPACVVLGEHEMALHMQQLMKQAGHEVPGSKPILEVNPSHPILELLDQEQDDDQFASWSRLLLDQALLADGGQLEDGAGFVKRMNEMFVALHSR